jgi:N-acetylglutamate synthase-like GNAT family acetyltransferase
VINGGGKIFLAEENGNIVGTAGLYKENDEAFELIKMAVDPASRGKGISKILLDKCLRYARQQKAKTIFLYSNSQLKTALILYEKYGFTYMPATDGPFVTADIKMGLTL